MASFDELATLRGVHLNLLVLRCADLPATRQFYECLGVTFAEHAHGSGPVHYAHEDGEFVFELYPAGEAGPDCAGVGLIVADLQEVAEQLTERGFEPGPIIQRPWGTTFVVRDPDGRRVEVQTST